MGFSYRTKENNTQDSQSELEGLVADIIEDARSIDVGFVADEPSKYKAALNEGVKTIEAYITTRVKEAEVEEVEMAADFAEDVLQQFGYNGKSGGLSTLEWAEGIIKRRKKLQALTTTTNGKEE